MCAAACPAGAITLRGKLGVPKLDIEKCIGCGACQAACPARPEKAMTVRSVLFQQTVKESKPTEEV
jgi:formate hydrogenlyase subunit 6/NADH:ubiquinone oxidoreductase subunit I